MNRVQHSSRRDDWWTPLDLLDRVRRVLGPIDLDPASSAAANERVQAEGFYTKQEDGLSRPWNGDTVFCNPPGGKLGNKSLSALFWTKCMQENERGAFDHAIFLAFSLEQLQTTQGKGVCPMAEFPLCIPAKRIRFDLPPPSIDNRAPSHSNVIAYVPGLINKVDRFVEEFEDLGAMLNV